MHLRPLLIAAALSLQLASAVHAQSPDAVNRATHASLREYIELLSIPNDAANPADILKNVEWLEAAFRKRGFATQQLPNNGKPLMYGEYGRKVAGAKTVLFYMHLDGQPVTPEKWTQKIRGHRC